MNERKVTFVPATQQGSKVHEQGMKFRGKKERSYILMLVDAMNVLGESETKAAA